MSNQGYAAVLSVPAPLATSGLASTALAVGVIAPMTIVWADGQPDDAYTPAAVALPCRSVYDGVSTTVDASTAVWLVVLSQGTAQPWLVKEADYATIGTLLAAQSGGEWAPYARIDGGAVQRMSQV